MKRLLLTCLILFSAFGFTGCLFSKKKSAQPKPNPNLAAGLEDNFRQLWVDRRTAELKAGGLAPEAAQAKAAEEFRARYGYIGSAKK